MRAQSKNRMTIEEFYDIYEHVAEKYELWDGVPIPKFGVEENEAGILMMAGGSAKHDAVSVNISALLRERLKGMGCRPFGSNMGLKLTAEAIAYPDAAIYCDKRDLSGDLLKVRQLSYPCVIFEVLSPSTAKFDQTEKLFAYQRLESVKAIVIVDPAEERLTLHQRTGPESWTMEKLPQGSDLVLTDPALSLTAADIFDLT
jgi:Uma2 family endonuclease